VLKALQFFFFFFFFLPQAAHVTVELEVEMTCNGCTTAVERALQKLSGVWIHINLSDVLLSIGVASFIR
jgi:hypothetical protein